METGSQKSCENKSAKKGQREKEKGVTEEGNRGASRLRFIGKERLAIKEPLYFRSGSNPAHSAAKTVKELCW